ncbi:MAG: HIT family protein [Patescibacteria group bacterium]
MDISQKLGCLFCDLFTDGSRTFLQTTHFFVILDNFPVNKGHTLIIPKAHSADVFSLRADEWSDFPHTLQKTKSFLDHKFHPDGYNIGINCGASAGQTIFHTHIHVIPRYAGDIDDPRGGIRNFKEPVKKYIV